MDVGHIVRRGGWEHEGMTSPIVFDMDIHVARNQESTLFETDSHCQSAVRDLRRLGSKRNCEPDTLNTLGYKPEYVNLDTKPTSVA